MTHPFIFLEWLERQLHLHIGTHVTYTWLVTPMSPIHGWSWHC
jgi:hypothetical protein